MRNITIMIIVASKISNLTISEVESTPKQFNHSINLRNIT